MYINTALLHEVRMVVQQASKLFKRAEKSRQGGSELLCVTCLRQRAFVVRKAVTVTRGNAVCLEHIS